MGIRNRKVDNVYHEKYPATNFLIALCISVFLIEIIFNYIYGEQGLIYLLNTFGFSFSSLTLQNIWTFVTSIFFHVGPQHLILNMIALFFFGRAIEEDLGWKKLLLIFFVGGVVGNIGVLIAQYLGIMSPFIATIGASGAIFALLGAAVFVKPLDIVMFPYIIPLPLLLITIM